MAKGYKDMLAEADAVVASVTAAEIAPRIEADGVVMVDIRDPRELEREGMIPGAFHAPRGMLEFWIDPESPYHKPRFAEGATYVFYCASGWRSLRGGFGGWKTEGHPVAEKARPGG